MGSSHGGSGEVWKLSYQYSQLVMFYMLMILVQVVKQIMALED
jgi:hypothetical protein